MDGQLPKRFRKDQALSHATTHLEQPQSKEKIVYVFGGIRMGNQRRAIPLSLTQGAETYLLRQQGFGRRRNQILKNRANNLSPSKRCPEALPLFLSSSSDRTN